MKFEIGEIVTVIDSPRFPYLVGTDCEIVGINVISLEGERFDYAVIYPNGPVHPTTKFWCKSEGQLKKKKPPEELGSWEAIQSLTNWNPSKIEVSQ